MAALTKGLSEQTRHLSFSVAEAHALFCSEFGEVIGKSKFVMFRPQHVFLSKKIPHYVCLCKYHENYISAVNAFHKVLPDCPLYNSEFVENLICEDYTDDCWLTKCIKCKDTIAILLDSIINNKDSPINVKWTFWDKKNGKLCKQVKEGSVHQLAEYITNLTPEFLEHSFVKRNQAKEYREQREKVEISSFNDKRALLQVDFSENFTCIAQDEIQSFHWAQPQVSLFTISLWHSGIHHPMIIASDNLDHGKNTVIAYIDRTLEEIPDTVTEVDIWSDGPSSQFKNRYVSSTLSLLQEQHRKKITWNYFSTSHGKGPVDGIGGAAKRQVRNSILQRKQVVYNASQFVKASENVTTVKVFEMTHNDIENRNIKMNLNDVFNNAAPFPGISKVHCINVDNGKFTGYLLTKHASCNNNNSFIIHQESTVPPKEAGTILASSKSKIANRKTKSFYNEVYGSSDSEIENSTPKPEDIKPDTYVLVKFEGPKTTYKYAAVCQSECESNGDIKILCLNKCSESDYRYKVNITDESYVKFSQILDILSPPTLTMQGDRIFYDFSYVINVNERV